MTTFKEFIQDIGDALGPTSGLDSEEVDHQELISLMKRYLSDKTEWLPYAFSDAGRNYTRNQVSDTNKKSNILVIVWEPGKGSPIHDHANAHCIMKILRGSLRETIYEQPQREGDKLKPAKTTIYEENQVTYISDKIGLHKVENVCSTDRAVSLHLYTPPHAHNYGFNLFDETTGKKSYVKTTAFYSDHGRLCDNAVSARI